jgi:hypothetical protein
LGQIDKNKKEVTTIMTMSHAAEAATRKSESERLAVKIRAHRNEERKKRERAKRKLKERRSSAKWLKSKEPPSDRES